MYNDRKVTKQFVIFIQKCKTKGAIRHNELAKVSGESLVIFDNFYCRRQRGVGGCDERLAIFNNLDYCN